MIIQIYALCFLILTLLLIPGQIDRIGKRKPSEYYTKEDAVSYLLGLLFMFPIYGRVLGWF